MGKKKDNLNALRRDDPKDNNWEIEENAKSEYAALEPEPALIVPEELKEILSREGYSRSKMIVSAWEKVSPEIRTDNPVWKYSVKDGKHFVFVFRSGQKARVEL